MRKLAMAAMSSLLLSHAYSSGIDMEALSAKLESLHIHFSVPGNHLTPTDGRKDTSMYFFLATPDPSFYKGSKPLLYMKEGLDSLAAAYTDNDSATIYASRDPHGITETEASRILSLVQPRQEVQRHPKYVDDLITNFPNPFNGTTTVHVKIDEDPDMTIRLVDMLGRVTVIFNGHVENTREFQQSLTMNNHPSGVYFLRVDIKTPNQLLYSTRKILYLK